MATTAVQTQIQTTPQQGLALRDERSQSTLERARELAGRLKFMIVNGNRLADPEVWALSQYAAATKLNPFNGECYYIPGVGPCPGIAGWRVKAQQALALEAQQQGETGAHMWTEEFALQPGEADFDPEHGDIGIMVVLHDWLTNRRWTRSFFDAVKEAKAIGMDTDGALELAKKMVGPEPVWTGIGIVYAGEHFAKAGAPEKMSRLERAKKRAEKIALRKRFTQVDLPEPVGADAEAIDIQFTDDGAPEQLVAGSGAEQLTAGAVGQPDESPAEKEARLLRELGFTPAPAGPAAPSTQPALPEEPPVEGDFHEEQPAEEPAHPAPASASTSGSMSLETARSCTDRNGKRFGEYDRKALSAMSGTYLARLKTTTLSVEEREQTQFKLDAIRTILASPAS